MTHSLMCEAKSVYIVKRTVTAIFGPWISVRNFASADFAIDIFSLKRAKTSLMEEVSFMFALVINPLFCQSS